MARKRWGVQLLGVTFTFVLLAVGACSKDTKTNAASSGQSNSQNVPQGGNLVIGAEQEPQCTDWIDQCAGTAWGTWIMGVTTLPHAFDVVRNGNTYSYQPSILLKDAPKLVTSPKQVVTYDIADNAVWSDGQPITSHDFKYTWDQIANGTDIIDQSGFDQVESVDDSNPKVAVVTFSTPYAAWRGMFGLQFGILPSHILEGQDRDALMKDGYDWSGGPWVFKWVKNDSVTLTPNPKWFGPKPHLDSVTFKFFTDAASEFQAYKSGQVQVIYPDSQPDAVQEIQAGLPDTNKEITDLTGNLEALWMNNAAPPFDDVSVRQAFGYIIDRNALVQRLFGAVGVTAPMQTFNANIFKDFADPTAFAQYTLDLTKSDQLLTSDGYVKGSDGIYAKNGQRLSVQIQSTTGDDRRALTEQILQQQLQAGGVELTVNNQDPGDLFGGLSQGNFQLALFAQTSTSFDPSLCNIFCIDNIPTADNSFSGNNITHTNIAEADKQLTIVDTNLDDNARKQAGQAADRALASTLTSLPLDPLPDILLWNTKVVGPIADNTIAGPFYNLEQWGVQK